MNEREELYKNLLIKKKLKGLEDLYFFNRYIVEQNEDRRKFIVPHVHREWSDWYSNSKQRIKMILVPRSSFKSTFITVGLSLQKIARDRNEKILLANATIANSSRFLTEIKDHMVKNEEYKLLYGEMYDPKSKWNETEIEVRGRRVGSREATITATGVGGNLVSTHFSTIIGDDLMNDENSATRLQTNKVIDWWKRSFSLLEPNGEMIIIGTRWSYYDLYSYIIDEQKKGSIDVDIFVRSIYNPDNSMYFPERFTTEKIKELRALHGSYLFSSFYLNNPVDEDSALIKKSQILYYDEPPQNLAVFVAIDPAVSQSTDADYSAILVVGVDVNKNWYVLDVRRGKWTVRELIYEIFTAYADHKPSTMSLEVIGQAQSILSPIQEEEEKRNQYLPIVTIKTRPDITKNMRIRSILQPRFENGKIFIKRSMIDLEDELLKFPKSKHDDQIDALADIEEIAFPADKSTVYTPIKTNSYFEAQVNKPKSKSIFVDDILGEYV